VTFLGSVTPRAPADSKRLGLWSWCIPMPEPYLANALRNRADAGPDRASPRRAWVPGPRTPVAASHPPVSLALTRPTGACHNAPHQTQPYHKPALPRPARLWVPGPRTPVAAGHPPVSPAETEPCQARPSLARPRRGPPNLDQPRLAYESSAIFRSNSARRASCSASVRSTRVVMEETAPSRSFWRRSKRRI
jgi:hypothetical protein